MSEGKFDLKLIPEFDRCVSCEWYASEKGKGRSINLPTFYLNQQTLRLTKWYGKEGPATSALWPVVYWTKEV